MNPSPPKSAMNSRREILVRCARWGGLLALGGIAARLGWQSRGKCDLPSACGGCPLFSGCALPKAGEARRQPAPPPAPATPKA